MSSDEQAALSLVQDDDAINRLINAAVFKMLRLPLLSPAPAKQRPDYLWHYTDGAGAAGIIQKRELWGSDTLFMNDPSELQLMRALFENLLDDDTGYLERWLAANEREAFTSAFWEHLSNTEDDPGVFAVSFCAKGDLLNQWRSYGRGGTGYALGFEPAGITGAALPIALFRVLYDVQDHLDAGADLVQAALEQLGDFATEDPSQRLRAISELGRYVATLAEYFGATIKHDAFEEEQEWRIIFRRPLVRSATEPRREFRASGRGLLPFIRFPFPSLPLSHVRTGPTSTDLDVRAMNHLLKDEGFDIVVQASGIPLRG